MSEVEHEHDEHYQPYQRSSSIFSTRKIIEMIIVLVILGIVGYIIYIMWDTFTNNPLVKAAGDLLGWSASILAGLEDLFNGCKNMSTCKYGIIFIVGLFLVLLSKFLFFTKTGQKLTGSMKDYLMVTGLPVEKFIKIQLEASRKAVEDYKKKVEKAIQEETDAVKKKTLEDLYKNKEVLDLVASTIIQTKVLDHIEFNPLPEKKVEEEKKARDKTKVDYLEKLQATGSRIDSFYNGLLESVNTEKISEEERNRKREAIEKSRKSVKDNAIAKDFTPRL